MFDQLRDALPRWNRKNKKSFSDLGFHSDAPFPHCDQRVLHAPGACEFCDHYPHYQSLRDAWGICFTGQAPATERFLSCPSDHNRGLAGAHVWHGNQPKPKENK